MSSATIKGYIPEVDGLRAVAIISVFLFHLSISNFSGGYVGVDIFFVISGYLITGLISKDLDKNSLSFFEFYARRFRRIYPALVTVVVVSSVIFGLVSPPSRVEQLGQTLPYVLLSLSNIFFWQNTSYFDPTNDQNPLLHTWSLGVEEQFYLIWPLALLIAFRLRGRVWFLLLAIGLGLVASEWAVRVDQTAAFYLTPFRIFQFATGGLVYWLLSRVRALPAVLNNLLFAIGLVLAIGPVFLFDSHTAFPGLMAAIPTFGAALVIFAQRARPLSFILGNALMAYIGRLSYSLYLTHWPTIVLYRELNGPPTTQGFFVIGAITVSSAVLLHYIVEQPARRIIRLGLFHLRLATWLNGIGVIAGLGLAASFLTTDGWTWRNPSAVIVTLDQLQQERLRYWGNRPVSAKDPSRPNILVMGDSHAVDFYYALVGNDVPNVGLLSYPHECDNVLDAGEETKKAAEWNGKCRQIFVTNLESEKFASADVVIIDERWVAGDHAALGEAIARARVANPGVTIAIAGPKFQLWREPIDILDEQKSGVDINQVSQKYAVDQAGLNAELKSFAGSLGVPFIDVYRTSCEASRCELLSNGALTYFDGMHWTAIGAKLFGSRLLADPSVQALLSPRASPAAEPPPADAAVAEAVKAPALAQAAKAPAALEDPAAQAVAEDAAPQPTVAKTSAEAAPVKPAALRLFWLTPENIDVAPTVDQTGARRATARVGDGIHVIRYGTTRLPVPFDFKWRIKFGNNDWFIVQIYTRSAGAYGALRLKKSADGVEIVDSSGVLGHAIVVRNGEWINLSASFSTIADPVGTQLILFPTRSHAAALQSPLWFEFEEPVFTPLD